VKLGHERGPESVRSVKIIVSREKLGACAMGGGNREWDMDNFSNEYMVEEDIYRV
jgi:hypothetical protein